MGLALKRIPFSFPAFLQGMGGVAVLLILLALWIMFRADKVTEIHQSKLANKTILIDRPQKQAQQEQSLAIEDKTSLSSAPFENMVENGTHGDMPIIHPDDKVKPFDAYKKPFEAIAGQAQIALVFNDIGLSKATLNNILNQFPSETTIAVSPYARDANNIFLQSRDVGHETWVMLPLEEKDFGQSDPGSKAILKNASLEQNVDRLSWTLSQGAGYSGVFIPQNHIYDGDIAAVKLVFQQIFDRGLALFENKANINSNISVLAVRTDLPHAGHDVYIDRQSRRSDVLKKFEATEISALRKGGAVLVVEPTPVNMKLVPKWIEGLSDKGLQLAPLSAVIEDQ